LEVLDGGKLRQAAHTNCTMHSLDSFLHGQDLTVSTLFRLPVLFVAIVRCEARGCWHLGLQGLQEDTGWWRLRAAVSDMTEAGLGGIFRWGSVGRWVQADRSLQDGRVDERSTAT
jgi:hypothetical protein